MPIKIDNLSYIYSQGTPFEKKALDAISVTINDNEMIGIIGHTGSGKSTFVQHLNALLYPTVGSVEVDGVLTTSDKKVLKSIRRKVGLVFQYPEHQLFELTVFQDVAFGPKNCGVEGQELKNRVEYALKAVGLDDTYYEKSPFELSGGQKRRVAIAGVIAMNPKFLILDEPTAGLDPIGREEILSMIQRLNTEKGITIIFVSHSMEDIAEYVKRIIVFDKGKILFDAEPIKVFAERTALKNCGLDVPISTKLIDGLNERSTEKIMPTLTANETVRAILEWLNKEEYHD